MQNEVDQKSVVFERLPNKKSSCFRHLSHELHMHCLRHFPIAVFVKDTNLYI